MKFTEFTLRATKGHPSIIKTIGFLHQDVGVSWEDNEQTIQDRQDVIYAPIELPIAPEGRFVISSMLDEQEWEIVGTKKITVKTKKITENLLFVPQYKQFITENKLFVQLDTKGYSI